MKVMLSEKVSLCKHRGVPPANPDGPARYRKRVPHPYINRAAQEVRLQQQQQHHKHVGTLVRTPSMGFPFSDARADGSLDASIPYATRPSGMHTGLPPGTGPATVLPPLRPPRFPDLRHFHHAPTTFPTLPAL